MAKVISYKIIIGILFSIPISLFAQFDLDSVPKFDSITVTDDTDIDSNFFVIYDHLGHTKKLHTNDTDSLQNYWEYLPAFADDDFYFSLGNTGSPAMNGYWQPGRKIGFDPGLHHLDLYRLSSDELPFFSTGRAYTKLHYTQAPQQTKSSTNALVGRAFDKGSGITVQYDRINDIGEFNHFRTRQTSAGAGLYFSPSPKSRINFSYVSNNFFLEENGGIQSDTFYQNPDYSDRSVIPVNITSAQTNWKEREVRLTSIWNLGKVQDTTTNGLSLLYDGRYSRINFLFYDANADDFYQQYAVHPDGQRASVNHRAFSNKAGFTINYGQSTFSKFKGKITGQVEYRWNSYTQDGNSRDINNLIAHARYEQQLSKLIGIDGNISFGLGDQSGNYIFNGKAIITPTSAIQLIGLISSQKHDVTGINARFSTLNNEIYNNAFGATNYNTIGGQLTINKLGLQAEVRNTIVDKYVYFDQSLLPVQLNETVNILQTKIGLTKRIGILYTENHLYLQNSDNDNIALPNFMSKHYIGIKYRLFNKNLHVDTGVRGIVLPSYDGYGYFPMLGKFYPIKQTVDFNYTITPIIGLKVNNFHAYFRLENMQSIWDDKPRFLIQNYPMHDFRVRIGLKWYLRG